MRLKTLGYAASIVLLGSLSLTAQAKAKKGGKKSKAKAGHCVEADGSTEAMGEDGKPLDETACTAKAADGFKWMKK